MSVIKKIFSGIKDEEVHADFTKYSRGVFTNKYLINVKRVKDKWNIKTSAEFVNYIVRECLKEVNGEFDVKGVIVATFDVSKEAGFPVQRIKQFMGIKQAVIETRTTPDKIITLMDKYPKAFFALTFSTPNSELKVKAKAPKSAKPAATGDKEPVAEFLSVKTTNKGIADDLLFGIGDFKEVAIKHILNIKDIVIPKGEKDPLKMRENAVRKGTIKRMMIVDEKNSEKEVEFEA
nr:hypothetical protein [uncultured archaeon]